MGGGGKWVDDGKGTGKKGGRKFAFKVLCPDALITMIMGPRGSSKGQLEGETGCRIIFSNRDEFFPGTYCRTLCIFGDDPEGICAMLDRMVDIVVQGAEQEIQQGPKGEPDFLGKEEGTFLLRVAISVRMSGAIIGPKGINIQAIRDETNAKLAIDKNNHFGHQLMKVSGDPDSLKFALRRVNDFVQAEAGTDDFLQWSSVRVFAEEGFGGKGCWEKGGKEPEKGCKGKGKARVIPGKAALADRAMEDAGGRDRERSPRRGQAPLVPGLQQEGAGSWGGSRPSGDPVGDIDAGMLQALAATSEEFPEGTINMEYTLTCELPTPKVSALIGKKGEHIREVRALTGAKIHFDEDLQGQGQEETPQQLLLIKGPLLRVYKAHALMMKKYHDVDLARQAQAAPPESPDVKSLQQQLEDLQRQLTMVQKSQNDGAGGGGFKGKGKSKGKGKK